MNNFPQRSQKVPKDDTFSASIVVTCKGRLCHLRQTLCRMLSQQFPFNYEIVVVDYGCPDGTFQWCRMLDLHQIKAVQVLDRTAEFSRSRSHNIGGRSARSQLLAFVDADIFLHSRWLLFATRPFFVDKKELVIVDRCHSRPDRYGTCVVSRRLFLDVQGYDERLIGWGLEDKDFFKRCRAKTQVGKFDGKLLQPIPHGDALRFEYHALKSRRECRLRNKARIKGRTKLLDQENFGIGNLNVLRGRKKLRFQSHEEVENYLSQHPVPDAMKQATG